MPQTHSTTLEPMTAITSTQIQVQVSKAPSRSPLTVADRAKLYGPLIVWSRIEGDDNALLMESPTSGNVYRVSLDTVTGIVSCNCPAKGLCYHALTFINDWKPLMMQAVKASRPSVYSAPVASPAPAVSAATFAADWM